MIPEQHDIEHYAWMDDVDDTCSLERELEGCGVIFAGIIAFAFIAGLAVWG